MNYKNFILILIFIGGFFFHVIWETKTIYVIPIYIMLLPSAANRIDELELKISEVVLKNKIKQK